MSKARRDIKNREERGGRLMDGTHAAGDSQEEET